MPFPPYVIEFRDESNAPISFTSTAEMQRLLSFSGHNLHLDDVDPEDEDDRFDIDTPSDVIKIYTEQEIIQRVTSRIMGILGRLYLAIDLHELPVIRQIATYWAVYLLTGRRGNQPLYEAEYNEGLDILDDILLGKFKISASQQVPRFGMQSYIIDNRSTYQPIRVLTTASTKLVDGQYAFRVRPFSWA